MTSLHVKVHLELVNASVFIGVFKSFLDINKIIIQ